MTAEKVTLIAAVISAIVAIITVKLSYTNEKKKWILEKRTILYLDIYDKIDGVLHDPTKVFDDGYFDFLVKIKPQIKLLASKKTFNAFEQYYNYIKGKKKAFQNFRNENDPSQRTHPEYDDNGEEYEVPDFNENDLSEYSFDCEKFRNENRDSTKVINAYVKAIYKAMRKDLGSNMW